MNVLVLQTCSLELGLSNLKLCLKLLHLESLVGHAHSVCNI